MTMPKTDKIPKQNWQFDILVKGQWKLLREKKKWRGAFRKLENFNSDYFK